MSMPDKELLQKSERMQVLRNGAPACLKIVLLYILNLFTHLLDQHFQLHRHLGGMYRY